MVRILKAIWEAFKWGVEPYCNHEAGVCIGGQGRECKLKIMKDGVEIERRNV